MGREIDTVGPPVSIHRGTLAIPPRLLMLAILTIKLIAELDRELPGIHLKSHLVLSGVLLQSPPDFLILTSFTS